MDQVSIGWWDISKIVLASGLLSALVSQGLQWLKESRREVRKYKAEATLNAIGLVGILDRYVSRCHQKIKKYDGAPTYYSSSEWCYPPDLDLADAKLEYFNGKVLSKLAWLKTERALALDIASDVLERQSDPESYQDHCVNITGYSGYEIALVSRLIRKEHKLPELSSCQAMTDKVEGLRIYWERAKKTLLS